MQGKFNGGEIAVPRPTDISGRFALTVVLLVAMSATAFAQFPDIGKGLGPSGAEVAGVIAGVAGITVLVLYFTLR